MAETKKEEVVYTKSTAQLDLEARMAVGNLPEFQHQDNTKNDHLNPEVTVAQYATETTETSEYRGTDPIYMTHPDDLSKPYAFEGAEGESVKLLESGVANVRKVTEPENEVGTESGVGRYETLNTAVSGETYAPKLVDAAEVPKDYAGSPGGVVGGESQEPVVVTKVPAASRTPSTPAASKASTKSN